jgi:hypothetical protein
MSGNTGLVPGVTIQEDSFSDSIILILRHFNIDSHVINMCYMLSCAIPSVQYKDYYLKHPTVDGTWLMFVLARPPTLKNNATVKGSITCINPSCCKYEAPTVSSEIKSYMKIEYMRSVTYICPEHQSKYEQLVEGSLPDEQVVLGLHIIPNRGIITFKADKR